jgi:hypothetical protein
MLQNAAIIIALLLNPTTEQQNALNLTEEQQEQIARINAHYELLHTEIDHKLRDLADEERIALRRVLSTTQRMSLQKSR